MHAANWLEDLTANRNQRLATVGKLLLVLHEVWGPLISVTSLLTVARLWQLHEICHLVQVHLENRAVNQTGSATASLLRPLNKILGSFQGQIDVAVTAQQLRFFPVLVKVTWAEHEYAGRPGRPLILNTVLHDLRVELAHCVTVCVAVIYYPVKLVELADLVFGVEAGEVFSCHEVLPQPFRVESCLACRHRRDAYYIRAVIYSAENLECLELCFCHTVFAHRLLLFERVHLFALFAFQSAELGRRVMMVHRRDRRRLARVLGDRRLNLVASVGEHGAVHARIAIGPAAKGPCSDQALPLAIKVGEV